jgi:hypothetical protein
MSVVLSQMDKPAEAIAASRRGLEVMNALAAAHPDNRLYQEYAYEHTDVIGDYFEALEITSRLRVITNGLSPASRRHLPRIPTTQTRSSGWATAKAALEKSRSRAAKSLLVWTTSETGYGLHWRSTAPIPRRIATS